MKVFVQKSWASCTFWNKSIFATKVFCSKILVLMIANTVDTSHMWLFKFKSFKKINIQFLDHNSHIFSAQWSHGASGYHTAQCGYRTLFLNNEHSPRNLGAWETVTWGEVGITPSGCSDHWINRKGFDLSIKSGYNLETKSRTWKSFWVVN